MRALLGLVAVIVIVAIAAFMFGYININQTQTAQLPQIHISGGQAPKFDVSTAKVDIGTKDKTVDVPTVDTETKTVSVPTVNVSKPK